MPSEHKNKTPSDLLRAYRFANAHAQHVHDTDEKLFAYHNVLMFCANSKQCLENESIKKKQILFWTYLHMGDLFLQKNLDVFEQSNQTNALEAYQKALEFTDDEREQLAILTKIRDIYRNLQDGNKAFQTSVQMAKLLDDALKIETFLNLANEATSKKEEIYFLEQALQFVTQEKIATLKKCEHTLTICARLLKIYEKAGLKADLARIQTIKKETENIMQGKSV